MRTPDYDPNAPKQTVSLTLNSDLYGRAKRLGLNASRIAEQALAEAYARELAAQVAAEVQREMQAVADYEERNGAFADLVRVHYERDDAV
ncbi:MAG: type II toxin-antitoxin system CcdA family antitoxin [Steroidobacteraceae bacterium]|nr:type II toxin-antitoxin system CcdA family antitoxin [Steroidobacteraceae bacterium]